MQTDSLLRCASCLVVLFLLSSSCDAPPAPAVDLGAVDGAVGDLGPDLWAADLLGDAGGQTPQEACGAFAAATCRKIASCYSASLRSTYGDEVTCAARVVLGCVPRLQLSGTSDTPAQVLACAAALGATSCDDYYGNRQPAPCQPQAGALPLQAPCGDSNQCQSTFCEGAAGGCGRCARRAQQGEPCQEGGCAAGTLCHRYLSQGMPVTTCQAPAPLRGACVSAPCEFSWNCFGGTCIRPESLGGACDGLCDWRRGRECDASRGCIFIHWSTPGMECGRAVTGNSIVCQGNGWCDITRPNPKGVCKAGPADGASCSGALSCLSPARCVAGRCALPDLMSCR